MTINNQKHTIMLIDDDQLFLNYLNEIIANYFPNYEVIGTFNKSTDLINELKTNKPNILISDIDMPDINGLELIDILQLDNSTKIVFITGHDDKGIEAIKLGAFDYLVKPVAVSDFKEFVQRYEKIEYNNTKNKVEEKAKLILNRHDKTYIIAIDDIIRIEAKGAYSEFYLKNENIITASKNLNYFENILPSHFLRIQKSHIVNELCIKEIVKKKDLATIIMLDGSELEISKKTQSAIYIMLQEKFIH